MKILGLIGCAAVVALVCFSYSIISLRLGPQTASSYIPASPDGSLQQLVGLYSEESAPICATMNTPPSYSARDILIRIKPAHFGKLGPVRMFPVYLNSGVVNGKPKWLKSPNLQKFCATYTAPRVRHFSAVDIRLVVRHQLLDRYPLALHVPPPRP
jgi:hypothetical protein